QRENRHARPEAEAGRARGTRIRHQDTLHALHSRPVRVTVDDHVEARVLGDEPERRGRAELMPVDHKDAAALQLDLGGLRQTRAQLEAVGVAPDRGHGSDRLQFDQDVQRADVAGVQNVLDVPEAIEYLGPQPAVGVADEADLHASTAGSPLRQRGPMVWSTPTWARGGAA